MTTMEFSARRAVTSAIAAACAAMTGGAWAQAEV